MLSLGRKFCIKERSVYIMNMLETLSYTVPREDCDQYGCLRICPMVNKAVSASTNRNRLEGASRENMREKLSAAWMVRRIQLRQFLPIRAGDEVQGFGSGRTMGRRHYAQLGELYCNGRLAVSLGLIIMPVELKTRRRLSCKDTEPLFSTTPLNEAPYFPHLPMVMGMDYSTERDFTRADCDSNASHLSFFRYPGLVWDMSSRFAPGPQLISFMQLDYIRECVAGSSILLGVQPQGKGYAVQARHISGKPCFNAYIEYSPM